jgi:hypothetical protein
MGGGVRGHVARADTAAPLAGAVVDLIRPPEERVITDAHGDFRFDSLAPGRYALRIRAIGFRPWQDTVRVVPEARPAFQIELVPDTLDGPCSGIFQVRVRKPWWKP